jgi:hypothetical protein
MIPSLVRHSSLVARLRGVQRPRPGARPAPSAPPPAPSRPHPPLAALPTHLVLPDAEPTSFKQPFLISFPTVEGRSTRVDTVIPVKPKTVDEQCQELDKKEPKFPPPEDPTEKFYYYADKAFLPLVFVSAMIFDWVTFTQRFD